MNWMEILTGKLMPDASSLNPTSVVVSGIANAFALSSVLYIAWDISGGHVNPAVTFAIAVGGHISVPTALFYWVAQLIASLMACLVLKVVVVGMVHLFQHPLIFNIYLCNTYIFFYLYSYYITYHISIILVTYFFYISISLKVYISIWVSNYHFLLLNILSSSKWRVFFYAFERLN